MHELSIAMSIADLAVQEAQQANASRINEIEIDVGDWSGVDYDALQFSLDAVLKSTEILKDAKLTINRYKPLMECKTCQSSFTPQHMYCMKCSICGAESVELKQGKELSLKSLIIED